MCFRSLKQLALYTNKSVTLRTRWKVEEEDGEKKRVFFSNHHHRVCVFTVVHKFVKLSWANINGVLDAALIHCSGINLYVHTLWANLKIKTPFFVFWWGVLVTAVIVWKTCQNYHSLCDQANKVIDEAGHNLPLEFRGRKWLIILLLAQWEGVRWVRNFLK